MSNAAALLVPRLATPGPAATEFTGSRAERLAQMRSADRSLDDALRVRLRGFEVEYLEGARAWIVRDQDELDLTELTRLIADLPVDVAPDVTFRALVSADDDPS